MLSPYPFLGRVISVTGAGSGIGLATAKILFSRGATVALADINQQGLVEAEKALRRTPAQKGQQISAAIVDVSKQDAVRAWTDNIVSKFGRLDHAANVAGVAHSPAPLAELSTDTFDYSANVNFRSVFNCMHAQLPHLKPGSSIVNVSSAVSYQAAINMSLYSASKSAINALTNSGAREYGSKGIRVNAVAPGLIMTPPLRDPENAKYLKPTVDATPLGRLGEADEVGKAICFLMSDEASYISGVVLRIDGGFMSITH
jgi:NAD(P)-dependent dehydrogenase (short-subunit alcohol dehydrogenase family)